MSVDIGTLYKTQIPALTDAADIQAAFKLYHYGTTSVPTVEGNILANSVAGMIRDRALIASPTFTGTVTSPLIRLTDITDASLTSTGHAFQIGSSSGSNLIIDSNEIMARNNGAASGITINNDGGNVGLGASTSTVNVPGTASIVTLSVTGDTTIGNASADSLTSNAASWTFVNATTFNIPASSTALSITSSGGYGLAIGGLNSASNPALFTPIYAGTAQSSSQFYFNYTANSWSAESNFYVGGNTTLGTASTDTVTVAATSTFNGPTSFVGAATATTQTVGDSSTKLATTEFVSSMAGGAFIQWFGDGSDGDLTISSGTTTLTRDMFYNNLTISGTGKLVPNGYRVFIAGTLDLTAAGASAISHTGGAGGTGGNGTSTGPGAGGAAGSNATPGYILSSTNGSAGGSGGSSAGVAITNSTYMYPYGAYAGAIGGTGGNAVTGGAGGSGGTIAAPTNTFGWHRTWVDWTPLVAGKLFVTAGGSGGGGGGNYITSSFGGGGGGGGASAHGVAIYARNISRGSGTAAGVITLTGGAGGAGGAGYSQSGNGAGGAGGQGGFIYIVYGTLSGTTKSAAIKSIGGAGGYPGGGGSSTGSQGGYSGAILLISALTGAASYTAPIAGTTASGTPGSGGVGATASVAL
jgi:hypothetical protein